MTAFLFSNIGLVQLALSMHIVHAKLPVSEPIVKFRIIFVNGHARRVFGRKLSNLKSFSQEKGVLIIF